MLQSAKAAAVGGAIARREHVPTLTQVPPMAPDSITAPWYGMVGWLGDVVYKYKYDESELEWNVSSFERRTCTRLAVGATLASANSRFTEDTAGQGSSPRALPTQITERKGKEDEKNKFRDSVLHVVYMLL